jgi:hypothetical protein
MVKELLYTKTGGYPSFISISGLNQEIVDNEDYILAYSEDTMLCYGASKANPNGNSFIAAMCNDGSTTKKDGFDFREDIKLAFYDSQLDDFFELEFKVTNWQTGDVVDLKFMNLGLFKVEVTSIGDLIDMSYDEELAEVKLEIIGEEKVDKDDYFFKVSDKNIKSFIVVTSGSGQIVEGRWWDSKQNMYCNYKYIPAESEQSVTITAVGTDGFTEEMVTTTKLVKFGTEQPSNEETLIFENEYYKIIKKPFRSFGDYIFVENKCQDNLAFRLYFNKDNKKTSNTVALKKGETDRTLSADYDSLYVGWIKIGWSQYERIDETYEL